MHVGAAIREHREGLGLTRREVARTGGLNRATLRNIEEGGFPRGCGLNVFLDVCGAIGLAPHHAFLRARDIALWLAADEHHDQEEAQP